MFIINFSNISSSKNNIPAFTARPSSILKKEIKLSNDTFERLSQISENYNNIVGEVIKLSSKTQTEFKELYPKLVSGEKIKGFVFDSILGLSNKRLQVAKYNCSSKQDELLTFNVLNNENKKLLSCRITKDGIATFTSEKDGVKALSKNPFAVAVDELQYLEELSNEFKNLEVYSKNFEIVRRNASKMGRSEKVFHDVITEASELNESVGLKTLNNLVNEKYNSMSDVLGIGKHRDATLLKDEYFQKAIPQKTKGLIFKNIDKQGRTYSICPLNRKSDNAIFKVSVHSSAGELENNFVFYPDGVVAMQKKLSESPDDFRPHNLEKISDKRIEELGIERILNTIGEEIDKFKQYICDRRFVQRFSREGSSTRSDNTTLDVSTKKERLEICLKEKTAKLELKEAKKLEREEARILKQQLLEAKLQAQEAKREQRLQAEIIKKQKQEAKLKKKQELELKRQKKLTQKLVKTNLRSEKLTNPTKETKAFFKTMKISNIVDDLNKIFQIPAENRGSHLVHEKLDNGKLFAGRFMFKASDGANVTVAKTRSTHFYDLKYYSIKVNTPDTEYVVNIDPPMKRIILSKDGKPVVDKKNVLQHLTTMEFLKLHPEAINLPKYMEELASIANDLNNTIISKKPTKEQIIRDTEREILKILAKADGELFQ